jgi:hypothetical protein
VRPNFTVGVVAAAGLTLAGALEAYLYARRSRNALTRSGSPAPRQAGSGASVAPLLSPEPNGSMRLGVSLSVGGS